VSELSCPVLTYHSANVYANLYGKNDHISLAADLQTIHNLGLRVIPLAVLVDWVLGNANDAAVEKAVCISFDDGCLLEVAELDFPPHGRQQSFLNILQDYYQNVLGATGDKPVASSFVIASEADRRQIDKKSLFGLGWMEDHWWAEAEASGFMDIQSHGWDHQHNMTSEHPGKPLPFERFTCIDIPDDCDREVIQAGKKICKILGGKMPDLFAYPYGAASAYMREQYLPEQQHKTGIRAAFSTDPEPVKQSSSPWNLPRFVCGRDWASTAEFTALLQGIEATTA